MADRPFLTYKLQLKRMMDKNILVSPNIEYLVIETLQSTSYHSIVNAYKDIYGVEIDQEKNLECFVEEVPFQNLHLLYLIDSSINNLLFKYIIYVEKSLRTKLSYTISKKIGVEPSQYLDFTKYRCCGELDRKNVIDNIKTSVSKSNNASIIHYRDNHDTIPPWIAVNGLYFGTLINWYKICPENIKKEILDDFFKYSKLTSLNEKEEIFMNMVKLLQAYRNNMAHGNRTFLTNVKEELSKNILFHLIDNDAILTENEYNQSIGKNDLYAVILSIAYLINDTEIFFQLISDFDYAFKPILSSFIEQDARKIEISPKGNIYNTINLPENIVDRLHEILSNKVEKFSI